MVAFDGSEACDRAGAYYHDFLEDEKNPAVPQAIIEHIERCGYCQRRLERLREALSELENDGAGLQSQGDKGLVAELQSQFEFLGEPLTCERVKAFLPNLLVPATPIRIPTPVTVHVDQCPACAKDLESLRALDLSAEQLARLSRLYADSSANGFWVCMRVQSKLSLVWPGSLEGVDAEALDHLCVCPRCRNRLYQRRQRLLDRDLYDSVGQGALCCADISAADIFDFVVPYGDVESSGGNGWFERCREHVRSCPHCLEKAQRLHRTVYGIVERPDSGVVTVYRAESDPRRSGVETESPYQDYPIDVQVTESEARQAVGATGRVRASARFNTIFRMALMAAAMIPIVAMFVWSARSASALSPRQLDEVVNVIPYVRVLIFGENLKQPKQTLLVLRPQRLFISDTQGKRTVTDLERGQITVFDKVKGAVEYVPRNSAERAKDRERFEQVLASGLKGLPWNGELTQREDIIVEGGRLEVYEMTGPTISDSGGSAPRKWVAYVEPMSRRPVKTEFFEWDPVEKGLMVTETRCFEYPGEGETLNWLEEAAGLAQF
jgi:uncharacterized protein YbaR (Trm112 family)